VTDDVEFKRLLMTIPEPLTCCRCGGRAFVRYGSSLDVGQMMRVPECYYCKLPEVCEYDSAPPSVKKQVREMAESMQAALGTNPVLNFVYRNDHVR